jgi:uncharacterized damage-inducible protein DinB
MDLHAHFQQTTQYNAWANRQALDSLKAISEPPSKAVHILAHIVGAERLWLARIEFGRSPHKWPIVWPELTLDECASALDELATQWARLLDATPAAGLTRVQNYLNSKGEPWFSAVGEIITHVTHHSAHHRGQIATLLGAAGHTPAYTDYIHAVRQGFLKRAEQP